MTSGRGMYAAREACTRTARGPAGVAMLTVWFPGVTAGHGSCEGSEA